MARRGRAGVEWATFLLVGVSAGLGACSDRALPAGQGGADATGAAGAGGEARTGGTTGSGTGGAGGVATGGTAFPGAGGTHVTSCAVLHDPGKGPGEGTQSCSEVAKLEVPVRAAPASPTCAELVNDGPAAPVHCPITQGDLCGGCFGDGLYDLVSYTLWQSNCGAYSDATARGVLRVKGDEIDVVTTFDDLTPRRHTFLFSADRGTLWLREICSDQDFFDPSKLQAQAYGVSDDELRFPRFGTFRKRR